VLGIARIKVFDTNLTGQTSTAAGGIASICNVPQGVAQAQRIADTIWLERLDIKMSLICFNADGYNHVRWGFFIWHDNNSAATPTIATIYSSTAAGGVWTPLSFENRERYSFVGGDNLTKMQGLASAPTSETVQLIVRSIGLNSSIVQYTLAATTGTGLLHFSNYSDSAAFPFPLYNLVARLWYYDEKA